MNRYDEQYLFRKATITDVDRIMRFIRAYWREDHILGNNREFFLYEHGHGEDVNFVICEDRGNDELVGIHGFIPYSHHRELAHVCGVMTMVKKDITIPMLGVELIKRFITITGYKTYCGIGTNSKTMVPLVKRLLHRHVGKMQHYYCLNEAVKDFKVAKIVDRKKCSLVADDSHQTQLLEFKDFDDLKKRFVLNKPYCFLPYKESWYLEKRYVHHPIYNYRMWGIDISGQVVALLVSREVIYKNTKILRFVDFIGEITDLARIGASVKKMIKRDQYEYADFLLYGVPEHIMCQAGFVLKSEEDN